jgi:hypothetical protein
MQETDKMLAEKDPLAMAMLTEYNGVLMPNLKLDMTEIQDLFEYIEEESHRVEHHRHGEHEHYH